MVDTQHFCLRWNNYQSSITSAFENLRDDEDFVDVTLACDGRSLKAHRVVLSACSPYFRELLKSTPCKHPVIVLQDVSFPDLHALVEFIYHGEVNVHQRSLSSFLKTAEVLRVSGLTQQQAEETNSQLAQIQNLANSGGRTSINHHSFSDKLHDDPPLFPQGASPPPHLNSLHPSLPNSSVNQLLRRAAAAAAFRRDRQNSNQSDDLSLKRHRPDNGLSGNNNSPDVTSHMPQVTAADFSTIKHNNNNTPPLKDDKCEKNDGNGQTGNGNGLSNVDKDSLTPSPTSRTADDVKSEPMELVCSNNNPQSDEHSNDSTGDIDPNRSSSVGDGKGSLSSANDDEIENSIHSHPPPPFLMSPADSKLFPTPGSYNFSMAALTDATLQGFSSQLQSAAELAGSPQDVTYVKPGTSLFIWRAFLVFCGYFVCRYQIKMLEGWYCRTLANEQAAASQNHQDDDDNDQGDSGSEDSQEGGQNYNSQVDYKAQYRYLKQKLKFLLYENEFFQDALRSSQRRLLKVSRDRSFLLDRLLQYEKPENSSTESEETESSDDDAARAESKKRKSEANGNASKNHQPKRRKMTKSKQQAVQPPAPSSQTGPPPDGHMTAEEVERHLQSIQSITELVPERAPATVPNEMFSNEPSLDSESNDQLIETSPSNMGEDCLSVDMNAINQQM